MAVISVERAELSAIRWAVELAIEERWDNVIIERDAQSIIKALQGSISRDFHTQTIIENIRSISSPLQQLRFQFCFREANSAVHHLAKRALASICINVWRDGGPSWISDFVCSDFSG